jgi:DNA-binding MarR family transcriptional regulator
LPVQPPVQVLLRMFRLGASLGRRQVFEQATAAAGLSMERSAVSVLVILGSADRALRAGEIAELMQVTGPHVTRLLKVLQDQGLIRRVADDGDQRVHQNTLTAVGQRFTRRYLEIIDEWFDRTLRDWSETDRAELARLFLKFADDLSGRELPAAGDGGGRGSGARRSARRL